MKTKVLNKLLWCYPVLVIIMQMLPPIYLPAVGIVLVASGVARRYEALVLFGLRCCRILDPVCVLGLYAAI